MAHVVIALVDPPCEVLEPRFCEVFGILRNDLSSCHVCARLACPGVAVFYSCAFRYVSGSDCLLCSVIYERLLVVPVHRRDVHRCSADHPVACSYLRLFVVLLIVSESGSCSVFAGCAGLASLVLRSESFRQSCQPYALCFAVIQEFPVLLPSDFAHVERSLIDVPVEHHVRNVVLVVFRILHPELRSRGVRARVCCGLVEVLGCNSVRESGYLYGLRASVIDERLAVIPVSSAHVEVRLVDAPGVSLRIRCPEVVFIFRSKDRFCEVSAGSCRRIARIVDADAAELVCDFH